MFVTVTSFTSSRGNLSVANKIATLKSLCCHHENRVQILFRCNGSICLVRLGNRLGRLCLTFFRSRTAAPRKVMFSPVSVILLMGEGRREGTSCVGSCLRGGGRYSF